MTRWLLALVLLCVGMPAQAQTFPKLTGLVVDDANVLPPQVEADLTAKLEALQKDTKRQLVVATIADMQGYPLADYGYRLGRAWGLGLKDVNNGAILFIAPNNPAGQRGPRIEVGRGLEPILTDALSYQIVTTQMMPRLKANGDIPGAMTAGADTIIAQLRAAPEEAQARTDAAAAEFDRTHARQQSSGGGLPIGLIFVGIIVAFVMVPMIVRGRRGAGRAYGGDGGALPIILWSIANEMTRGGGGSGGGGWSGGSSGGSDGSWGGGGFTGGGGGRFRWRRGFGGLVMRLTEADHARVSAAVTQAEQATDGEIVTLVAPASDSYHDVAAHWAVLAMLLALAILATWPVALDTLHARFADPWETAPTIQTALTTALTVAAITFLLFRLLFTWTPLRLALTPRATRARRVRRRAVALFRATVEQRTRAKTGVLLYLSLAERRAEIVADTTIHARVAPEVWGEAMAALILAVRDGRPGEGMADAITRIGIVLAEHFPVSTGDTNELPDRLIEL